MRQRNIRLVLYCFCTVLLSLPMSSQAQPAPATLGKTLVATVTSPQPTEKIALNVYEDSIFHIAGIAQRFSPVNLYVYAQIPEKILDFTAAKSGSSLVFSWTPRQIFQRSPYRPGGGTNTNSYRYVQWTGTAHDAQLEVKQANSNQSLQPPRRDTIAGTVTVLCELGTGRGTARFDLNFSGNIFTQHLQETRDAAAICRNVNAQGHLSPSFTIPDFNFPLWGGSLEGRLDVAQTHIDHATSRWQIKQDNRSEMELVSGEGCPLIVYTVQTLSFFSGNSTLNSTIEVNARINSSDPQCSDMDGKRLVGSVPLNWSRTLTNITDSQQEIVACSNLKSEMPPAINCHGLDQSEFGRPYQFYDHVVGYRDAFPPPGQIVGNDYLGVNSNFMRACEDPGMFLLDVENGNVNDNGTILIPGGCTEVMCDYSNCRDSFCNTSLTSCTAPVVTGSCAEVILNQPQPACRTVDTGPDTGWLAGWRSAQDYSSVDTPGPSGAYPVVPARVDQIALNVANLNATFDPLRPGSQNYRRAGPYLFVYATRTEELSCSNRVDCGYDIVADGAANSYSNYPVRDYLILADGFQQYELYALPAAQYAANEGVTRENGTLVSVIKDPAQNTVRVDLAALPAQLANQELYFALFEVREGPSTNRGFQTSRVPRAVTQRYTNQNVNGMNGQLGHLLTTTREVRYDGRNAATGLDAPAKVEWEIMAEEGNYQELGLLPITADQDEHFVVQGTTPEDEQGGKRGIDAYVLNRFADSHFILATYRSSDTVFQSDAAGSLLLRAGPEAFSILTAGQTLGQVGLITAQTFNVYGLVYDLWTKNPLPGVRLKIQQADQTRLYEEYHTSNGEGLFTFLPPAGTYTITPLDFNAGQVFLYPPTGSQPGCTSGIDSPYRDIYCQQQPFQLKNNTQFHRDIPLQPTVQGLLPNASRDPAHTWRVSLASTGGILTQQAEVTPEGKFSFFVPTGTYTIQQVTEYNAERKLVRTVTSGLPAVTVVAGSSATVTIPLTP